MSERPAVDVVVPFFGSGRQLVALLDRLQKLRLGPDDTLTVVDNRPVHASDRVDDPRVVLAPQVQSAPYSRNSGAQRGSNEWIVFIDADVDPAPDVIEQYFVTGPPADDVAVLAGAIHDQDPRQPERRTRPPRATCSYASAWPRPIPRRNCAKTANAAFRRSAFDAVGGFHTNLVCGEDVDFSLLPAGRRGVAPRVPRRTSRRAHWPGECRRGPLRQQAKHGTGTGWLDKKYPSFSPPFRPAHRAIRHKRDDIPSVAREGGAAAIVALVVLPVGSQPPR